MKFPKPVLLEKHMLFGENFGLGVGRCLQLELQVFKALTEHCQAWVLPRVIWDKETDKKQTLIIGFPRLRPKVKKLLPGV